ncbi:P-loop containing nucleoside triphosphate hydrolase protein [Penicillium malachiteum]|uniref:P-loop containing nucleoside triphosphate hydrolase protein n=1 Tax=Penicillium malachiteum TaxID=1324776 RepID=UPI002546F315|nr:P-loop containing nucleoside triphosphate hydrolase protein [Penicillium malachiteum]KAJ5721205.1 P-loop containing nucleoside triphosphate hydrolase protein [Penicillium malachiteum]
MSVKIGIGVAALVLLSSIPSWLTILRRRDTVKSAVQPGYRDEDGEAEDESPTAAAHRWQCAAILGFSFIGLGTALGDAMLALIRRESGLIPLWLYVGDWIVSCIQAVALFVESSPVRRFTLSNYAFGTSAILVALLVTPSEPRLSWSRQFDAIAIVRLTTLVATIARGFCCMLLPRRSNVYWNGKLVDREHTVSLLNRLTFHYITPTVELAAQKQGCMKIDCLPELPFSSRSESLFNNISKALRDRPLWRTIVAVHQSAFLLQAAMTLMSSVLSFGPQITLYGILKCLEDGSTRSVGFLVVTMGVTICLSSTVTAWLWWISYSKLNIPIYSQLLALIYAKTIRRMDFKVASSDECGSEEQGEQDTINLATVDTMRISEFATQNHMILNSLSNLLVAAILLIGLLGWRSVLAGFTATFLVLPLSTYFSNRYIEIQQILMQAKDRRAAVVTEVVQNIRQIKFSAIEKEWYHRVIGVRQGELKALIRNITCMTGVVAVWTLSPLLLSAVSLSVYSLTQGPLTASVAFTALSIFGPLEDSLMGIPYLVSRAVEANTSCERIVNYLQESEIKPSRGAGDEIIFENADITWPAQVDKDEKERFHLTRLSLHFPSKALSVICGKTGSGKGLLLSAILSECDILSGAVHVPFFDGERYDNRATRENWIIDSAVAYVAQNPWTENATIKDNIIFGLPFDQARYQEVLHASALETDLQTLPHGDLTNIGANGVNISGGQRWRVSFARALYSRAGVLVFDDIFSALDADTGRHVYEYGLTGSLSENRTRVLATHHFGLCSPSIDYCVLLENGTTSFAGTMDQLMKTDRVAADLLGWSSGSSDNNSQDGSIRKREKRSPWTAGTGVAITQSSNSTIPPQFNPDEKREKGAVAFSVYRVFLASGGNQHLWALALLTSCISTFLLFSRSWWVTVWTSLSKEQPWIHIIHSTRSLAMNLVGNQFQIPQIQPTGIEDGLYLYIGLYVAISLTASALEVAQFFFLNYAAMKSSKVLFQNILSAVLAAPLRWLDTTPSGRIINRFTADIYQLDCVLGPQLATFMKFVFQLLGILIAGVLVSPVILIPATVLLGASWKVSSTYLAAAREMKRLESVSRSPIIEHFNSTLLGLGTIRAYGKAQNYQESVQKCIDTHSNASRHLWLFNWWAQIRIGALGAIFAVIVTVVIAKIRISASLAGFVISFILQYNIAVSTSLRLYSSVEMAMNGAERVIEYTKIETETQDGIDPPAAWPIQGKVEVHDLVVGYAPELPPVLNGLTFHIENNQRVGVVGRTGAGKSSLTLALFRFLEYRKGKVVIDGLDISNIKLSALRSRLAIVPQHPVLFSGTIRSNLDPFDKYSDTELNAALERVQLIHPEDSNKEENSQFSLSTPVSQGGLSFSQGQRQLLCLARSILQQPKIMILDEATSAVDKETDNLIQQAIRTEFGRNSSSLLVIAHRLSTVADFDRILVMDQGQMVEFGTPQELLSIQNGVFKDLVEQCGEKAYVEQIIYGKN